METAFTLSDIIPLLHIRLRGCLLYPFTDEWQGEVNSLCTYVELNRGTLTDFHSLKDEIRGKIQEGILNPEGLHQFITWLKNSIILPINVLTDELSDVLQDPLFVLSNEDLRKTTLQAEYFAGTPILGHSPLDDNDKETALRKFITTLRNIKDYLQCIRQCADTETRLVTGTHYLGREIEPVHGEYNRPKQEIRTNGFNSMPLEDVRKWFIQLAENNSKNGKPFLIPEQVDQFIERAFCDDTTIEKLVFNMSAGERTSLTKLFYLFFTRCTNNYAIETTKHCKEKYVRLLTDNETAR